MSGRILLTGATGNTGSVIAAELARRAIPFVAMARSDANRARLRGLGYEVVAGDFDDPASLERALRGVERAYLVCTPDEHLVPREAAFVTAARRAGVGRIVKCSAYWADEAAETENLRSHGRIERALRESGLEWTSVRPHGFMQTFTLFGWELIQKAGVITAPMGDGGLPLVDVRDVAQVALAALLDQGHAGKAYDVTGPEVLDGYQQAEILARVLGRPISYLAGGELPLRLMLRLLGVTPTPTEHTIKIFRAIRAHRCETVHQTQAALGLRATPYEEFLRDYVAGRTGGGNSFQPASGPLLRLIGAVTPPLLRLRLRLGGRPARPGGGGPGAPRDAA